MNKQIKILILLVFFIVAPSLACGGSDSLNPAGNAETIETEHSTTYIYPENDSMESCTYWDNGTYSCKARDN